jgi:UDP-N-acetylglucosamine 4-epimerase
MRVLITGGAGFIGSNLVEHLLKSQHVSFVRVLDNLATGSLKNIEAFFPNPKFEFVEGDYRNIEYFYGCEGKSYQTGCVCSIVFYLW